MDPDATLLEAADSLADRDLNTTLDRLDDLHTWTDRGGFGPSVDASRTWGESVTAWEHNTGLSWPTLATEAQR